jgi:hypothetical protein
LNDARKSLLKGAFKSFVSGSTGVVMSLQIIDPEHFSVATLGGWKHLGAAVLVTGFIAEARFWNQWSNSGEQTPDGKI